MELRSLKRVYVYFCILRQLLRSFVIACSTSCVVHVLLMCCLCAAHVFVMYAHVPFVCSSCLALVCFATLLLATFCALRCCRLSSLTLLAPCCVQLCSRVSDLAAQRHPDPVCNASRPQVLTHTMLCFGGDSFLRFSSVVISCAFSSLTLIVPHAALARASACLSADTWPSHAPCHRHTFSRILPCAC